MCLPLRLATFDRRPGSLVVASGRLVELPCLPRVNPGANPWFSFFDGLLLNSIFDLQVVKFQRQVDPAAAQAGRVRGKDQSRRTQRLAGGQLRFPPGLERIDEIKDAQFHGFLLIRFDRLPLTLSFSPSPQRRLVRPVRLYRTVFADQPVIRFTAFFVSRQQQTTHTVGILDMSFMLFMEEDWIIERTSSSL